MKHLLILIFILLVKQGFCQNNSPTNFITAEEATKIAAPYGLHDKDRSPENIRYGGAAPSLDTANKVWKITTTQLTFHRTGKTTKLHITDKQYRCKDVNGCYTIHTRVVWVNAVTGKIIKKGNEKVVSGSFE